MIFILGPLRLGVFANAFTKLARWPGRKKKARWYMFNFRSPSCQGGLYLMGLIVLVGFVLSAANTHLKAENNKRAKSLTEMRLAQATGPLRVHPANPRYFTDGSGRAIYLTGSHTWANLQDAGYSDPPPVFDYTAYLDFLETNHHDFFRLWAWEQAKWAPWTADEIWFNPMPYQRPGPGTALDGKPKFDVTQFNQAYFDRLRARVIQAGERGMYVSIMLFDGFSVDDKDSGLGNPWQGHPYNARNNINGIDGDLNKNGKGEETHTLQIPVVTAVQEAYVRKVIDTINDLDNVLYEISNESHANSQNWQYHMINFIKNCEANKPKQHPVGMTVEYPGGDNAELFASPADWISPNDNGGYKDNPPAADGRKVIILDTDHLWGIGGARQWVWKSFTRGYNPIYMDCYDAAYCEGLNPNDPTRVSLVANMGYVLSYANRMNLATMTPRPELCSTQYCLANPVASGAEYLVYLPSDSAIATILKKIGVQDWDHIVFLPLILGPSGSSVTVDLSAASGELSVEWFNPGTGEVFEEDTITGGASRSFGAPFRGDAVLYIHASASATLTPNQVPK
jgi:hypothetical protein